MVAIRSALVPLVPRALLLFAVGAGAGFAGNALRSDGVALAFQAPTTCGPEQEWLPQPDIALLPPEQAASLCSELHALVIDTRSAVAFAEGHIAGALHLPCTASADAAQVVGSGASPGELVLVYADSTEEALPVARELQKRLSDPSQRVSVLDGGFPAWRDANLACASGGCASCGEAHVADESQHE